MKTDGILRTILEKLKYTSLEEAKKRWHICCKKIYCIQLHDTFQSMPLDKAII